MATGQFCCPYCTTVLVLRFVRKTERAYVCPGCHWMIHREDIFRPQPQEVPDVRHPGDATGEDTIETDIVVDMSDALPHRELPTIMLA